MKYSEGDAVITYFEGDEVSGIIDRINGMVLVINKLKYVHSHVPIDPTLESWAFDWDESSVRLEHENFYIPPYIKTLHPLSVIFVGSMSILILYLYI